MQSLDVISINLWQILISLANLVILFLIIKKFLFKPVKKMLADREAAVDAVYSEADKAREKAESDKKEWAKKLSDADAEAESIINKAMETATVNSNKIIADAGRKADGIIHHAENEAEYELEKAKETIRREIVDVSSQIAEKVIDREINEEDHRNLIESFIDGAI